MTFKNLFNLDISKSIINHFWQYIEKDMDIYSIDSKSPSSLLETIINSNKGIKHTKALKLLSVIIIGQEVGLRTLRNILNLNGKKNDYWYRLIKELKDLNFPKDCKYQSITEINKSIRNFMPLKLKYYQ
ncbi:unnamed protein product [marine sediment metagenome]|uniref:HhH-GPD domain-containing protein n=1 Tax=marine sediment metagenome TaxID=412755 RepID=X0ZW10_9ZZZZ